MELQKYEQEHLDIPCPLLLEYTVLLKKNGDFLLEKPEKMRCMVMSSLCQEVSRKSITLR